MRRGFVINAVGTACKDNSLGGNILDFLNINSIRQNFSVNITFTHSACNQLIILTAEVEYNYGFLITHILSSSFLLTSGCLKIKYFEAASVKYYL